MGLLGGPRGIFETLYRSTPVKVELGASRPHGEDDVETKPTHACPAPSRSHSRTPPACATISPAAKATAATTETTTDQQTQADTSTTQDPVNDLDTHFRNLSVAELAELGPHSVMQLVMFALGVSQQPAGAKKVPRKTVPLKSVPRAPAAKPTPTAAPGDVDVRTKPGRDAYDAAILGTLQNANRPQSSTDLRAIVGGTTAQLRQRLNSMIGDGKITYTGKARGTRYEVA